LPSRPIGFPVAAYIEAHIEQDIVLEEAGLPIGIVTGIEGQRTWRIDVRGREDKAATAPMEGRRDAMAAMALIVSALYGEVATADPAVKFTVGQVAVHPNAPTVIAGKASFSIDLRHPDSAVLERLGAQVEMLCRMLAEPCRVTVERLVDCPAILFDAKLQDWIESVAQSIGHGAMRLMSPVAHDSRNIAARAPTAMIFVPCRNGVSRGPAEWAEPAHVTAGAEVLLASVLPLLAS
jgi:N-carbamoyl-L-amino-acid hydrolase